MTPEETRDRQALYRDVQYERMSPAEADAQLRQWGQEPFQSRPDPSRFDPMTESEWTLPMAAAWFIWRSPDAVRDQWNPARNGWQKWVRVPKRKNTGAGSKGPRWELKRFERATLAEVFSQARLRRDAQTGKATALWSVLSDRIHTPCSRLKDALKYGDLRASWGKRGSGDFEELPPEYWQRRFEAIANPPKKQPSSNRPASAHVRLTTRTLTFPKNSKQGRETVQSSASSMPTISRDEFEDLPDLSLTEKTIPQTLQLRRQHAVPNDENDGVFFRRDDIILAERSVSQVEYEHPDWSLGQALGWVAYQRRDAFRSLWETDLNPLPDYYGETYSSDFVMDDPASALMQALITAKLIGYLGGEPITSTRWLGSEVWNRPHVQFVRADVIKIWKEVPTATPVKKPRPSKEKMTEIHEGLNAERGSQPSEQEFRDRLGEYGFDSNVKRVREFREKYAAEKGITFEPGPRGKRKPRPDPTQRPEKC